MGGKPSTLHHNDDDSSTGTSNDCQNRCFFKSPFRSRDPIGSPLPETPMQVRRQRAEIRRLNRDSKNGNMFSSRYGGLEKETTIPPAPPADGHAQVHRGKDAESKLHAKYQLMESLGVGSTSTCHRCVHKGNDKHYACKVIDKRVIESKFQGMMDQFETEIDALRSLQHDNIIRLYDVYISEEKIFIVMELMEGGELFDYVVQKGTLTEKEAARIVERVTSALVYMHSKNIVHRDLKPENLLLRRRPRNAGDSIEVKIIDFGLSKCMQAPVASTFLGTRGYLAPEMLQRRDYTKAVDTWALGVIVFVLLCGCLPFDDDSQTVPSDELVRAKFVLSFPRWANNLSPSAKDLLAHLLDVNEMSRYTAEQAFRHPWVSGNAANKKPLPSPRRMRASPGVRIRANRGTPTRPSTGKYFPPSRTTQQQPPDLMSSPQNRVIVRKTSI